MGAAVMNKRAQQDSLDPGFTDQIFDLLFVTVKEELFSRESEEINLRLAVLTISRSRLSLRNCQTRLRDRLGSQSRGRYIRHRCRANV